MDSGNASRLLDVHLTRSISKSAEIRLIAKNLLSDRKSETTTQFRPNGSFANSEAKTERSRPTLMVAFESRF